MQPDKPKRRFSFWRLLVAILVVTLVLVAGLYFSSPWLVAELASRAATQLSVDRVELRIGYPRLTGVDVDYLMVESERVSLVAERGEFRHRWRDLADLSRAELDFDELRLSVHEPPKSADDSSTPSLDTVFSVLPFRAVTIHALTLKVAEPAFLGHGELRWEPSSLTFDMRGAEPEVASRFAAHANLTSAGEFSATLSTSQDEGQQEGITVSGAVNDSELNVFGDLRLQGYALSLVTALAGVAPGTGRVEADFDARLPWPLPGELALRDLALLVPSASVDWQSDAGDLLLSTVRGALSFDGERLEAQWQGSVRGQVDDSLITATAAQPHSLRYESSTLTAGDGLRVQVGHPVMDLSADVHALDLHVASDTQVSIDASIHGRAEGLDVIGKLSGSFLMAGNTPDQTTGDVTGDGSVSVGGQLHKVRIASQFALDNNLLSADGAISASVFDGARFSAAYHLDSGAGTASIRNTIRFSEPLAAALVPDWSEPYDVDGGVIAASLNLNWQTLDAIAGSLVLGLTEGSGHYDDTVASGVRGEFRLDSVNVLDPAQWILTPTQVDIELVDVGLPITQVRLRLAWREQRLSIVDARARLLGGSATATPFDYADGTASFAVALERLELAEILALEGDDISGTGVLDGLLPIVVRDDRPSIANGRLTGLPPGGVVQLQPTFSGLTGEAGLEFALLALKDFRYRVLTCGVDYEENGDLALAVHLEGHNPAVEKGRTIRYNLNISENVPALLRTLQLDQGVTRGIEKRVQGP